ncbi:MAG: EamA family transporter [Actinomycetota bacterium]
MLPLLLALGSGLAWGSADFVGGLMTKRLAPTTVLVVSQTAGLAFMVALVVALGEPMPETHFLAYGLIAGLAGAVGLAALYKGLAVGRMSIVAPIAALSGAVPVAAGFLQGERPAGLQLAGMALAGAGVLLAARASEPDVATPGGAGPAVVADGAVPRKGVSGVAYGLTAALFLGLLVTFLDASGEGNPYWASFMVRCASVPLFAIAWFLRRERGRRPTVRELWVLAVVGLFDNGANVTFAIAASQGLLAVVSVLGSLYPVSTVLLARFVLHERLAPLQTAGVASAFAGVALIALG